MIKNIKYLGIPLIAFVIAITATTILSKAARINFDSVMTAIFSKIPILDDLIETDYNTGLYGITQMDMAEMRTAEYNVDFLMSISAPNFDGGLTKNYVRQYLAIYPYVVEAGINLKNVKNSTSDGITTINLPSPLITLSDLDENRGVTVIRNTNIPPELINMMKKTFEKRAIDLAYNSGIINNAKDKAEKYFVNLFPKEKFEFCFADEPQLYDSMASNKTPIKFIYRKDALDRITTFSNRHRKIQTDESIVYFNPADIFVKTKEEREFVINYNFNTKKTVSEFNDFINNYISKVAKDSTDCYFVKYFDSQFPDSKRISTLLWWDETPYFTPVFFTSDNNQYTICTKDKIYGNEMFKVYGDLMYLATCCKNQDITNTDYITYLQTYDNIIHDIDNKKYEPAHQKLEIIKEYKAKNGEPLNYAEKDLQSIIALFADNKYEATGYDQFDTLLKAAYIFRQKDKNLITPDFQKMVLSHGSLLGLTEIDLNYMIEYFYNLTTTLQSDRKKYRETLIDKGYYNDEIFNSLSGTEFCNYLIKIMRSYDNKIAIQDNRLSNTTIVGYDMVLRNDNYSQIKIQNFLTKHNLQSNNGLVVWCFKPEGAIFNDYPLIIFYKDKVTYIPNYKPLLGEPKIENEYYTKIDTHKGGVDINELPTVMLEVVRSNNITDLNSYDITIGSNKFEDKVLYLTIREIKDRKLKFTKTNNWINKIETKMQTEIMRYCKRTGGIF